MNHDTQSTQKQSAAAKENPLAVPRFRLQVFVPRDIDRRLEVAAVQQQITKSQLVEDALRAYLRIETAAV